MAKINIKLSPQQQKILVGGAIGLIAGGFCYVKFFWSPISDKIAGAEKDIEEVEKKIDEAQRVAGRQSQLEAELKSLTEQSIEAEKRLPKKKSTADILVTISELAQTYNVSLLSFTPGAVPAKGGSPFFTELPYPVSIKGSYHNIGKFLAAVSLEERIFNVRDVRYSEPAADSGLQQVTFTLISYQYKG